jgi:hypothetical protein
MFRELLDQNALIQSSERTGEPIMSKKNVKKTINNGGNNGAPKGFRKVDGTLLGFWKPDLEGEVLQGTVGSRIEAAGSDGKPNVFFAVTLTDTVMNIVTSDDETINAPAGSTVGVGGKMLITFLEARAGQEVALVYRGLGKAKPRQSAPRLFDTFEREGA